MRRSLFTTFNTRSSTQPPSSFISGTSATLTNESFSQSAGIQQFIPWGGGQYTLVAGRRQGDDELRSTAASTRSSSSNLDGERHAAAAAQLRLRQHPPADRDQPEQPGDRGPRTARAGGDHDAGRAQRLLRPDRRHRRPRRWRASRSISRCLAQEQPDARRGRHAGADRHHRGRGRSRANEENRDQRRGADQDDRGSAALAGHEPGAAGLLDDRASSRPTRRR